MNFFAAASLSKPSRGFILVVSILFRFRNYFAPFSYPSFFLENPTIFFSSTSRGISSVLSFLFETETSLLHPFLFLHVLFLFPSTQVLRISTYGVVRNHREYHGDRPAHGSSLSFDSDLRQLEYDRSVTLFISLPNRRFTVHFIL